MVPFVLTLQESHFISYFDVVHSGTRAKKGPYVAQIPISME